MLWRLPGAEADRRTLSLLGVKVLEAENMDEVFRGPVHISPRYSGKGINEKQYCSELQDYVQGRIPSLILINDSYILRLLIAE
jgi:hypothetical protein